MERIPRQQHFDPRELRDDSTWDGGHSNPLRTLVTFDDGWAGSFEAAGPILKSCGARAIVFVTTGLIGKPLFFTPRQLQALSDEVFEIGSHTVTHPFLNELPEPAIRRELMDSRRCLEDLLGRPVETISIPNGAIDRRVRSCAQEAGYRFIFTSATPRPNAETDPLNIGRVALRRETSMRDFEHWISGDVRSAGWRMGALSVAKGILGSGRYRRWRARYLGEQAGQDEMASLLRDPLCPPVMDAASIIVGEHVMNQTGIGSKS
jgi:hypothetical protein